MAILGVVEMAMVAATTETAAATTAAMVKAEMVAVMETTMATAAATVLVAMERYMGRDGHGGDGDLVVERRARGTSGRTWQREWQRRQWRWRRR